jgi:beta-galactosidase
MWQVVAHGARELAIYAWYPMSSGFESNGYGLIDLDGTITDRARAAGKVAKLLQRHASDLLNADPAPASVAILYNRLSYMVGGSQPSASKLGNAERDSLMGLYRAFMEQHIPVDFVDPQELAQNKLAQYKILFLPFPVMLSRNAAEGVKRYVQSGGTAVAEARLAWNDERGFASDVIPGFGLDEVFGAKEKLIRPAEKPEIRVEASGELPGLAAVQPIVGAAFEEDLEPLNGGQVLGRFSDGEPAIVAHTWGKGKAILVGSFTALGFQQPGGNATGHFFLSLARAAGVTAQVALIGPQSSDVEVRRLVSDHEQIVFVFNHAPGPFDADLSIDLPWKVRQARDLSNESAIPFQTQNGKAVFHKRLAKDEIWVFRLEGQPAG